MTPSENIVPSCICGDLNCKIPFGYCHCGCGEPTKVARQNKPQFKEVIGLPRLRLRGHHRLKEWARGRSKAVCICGESLCEYFGKCHCGCGNDTPIAIRYCRRLGHIKGMPVRYLPGHQSGSVRDYSDANTIIIMDGIQCRRIPLTKEQWSFVDEEDFHSLTKWKWFACERSNGKFYAARNAPRKLRKLGIRFIYMHREILGLSSDDRLEPDHVEPSATLDNRKINLRPATHSENLRNASLSKNNKSGRKGVSWRKETQKWHAAIGHNGKSISLGDSDDFVESCRAREEAEKKYHGEFARAK